MRPEPYRNSKELYECFECGARISEPGVRVCARCGGELLNIGRSRDL